jgi:hypothetical protein
MTTHQVFEERLKRASHALRTSTIRQCEGSIHGTDGSMCALGVACRGMTTNYYNYLPNTVSESIWILNDTARMSFAEIADVIDSGLIRIGMTDEDAGFLVGRFTGYDCNVSLDTWMAGFDRGRAEREQMLAEKASHVYDLDHEYVVVGV